MKNLNLLEKWCALISFMFVGSILNDFFSGNSQLVSVGEKLFVVAFCIVIPGVIAKVLMDKGKGFFKWFLLGMLSAGLLSGFYLLFSLKGKFGEPSKQANQESPEERKERLIKKYGEVDGLRIFNGEISESKHKELLRQEKKKEEERRLIKTYGEVYGLKVFEGEIAERSIKKLIRLHKKYGEEIGDKLFYKKLFIGMTNQMLIDAYGNPSDRKETVTKNKTIRKCYFLPRTTRQKTIVYDLEVVLENGKVIKWKED